MICDLDFAVKPLLAIDAKATKHILHGHWEVEELRCGAPVGADEIRAQSQERRKRSQTWERDHSAKQGLRSIVSRWGYANMDEEYVQSGWQAEATFWDFGSAVSSKWQAAGGHVQKSASRDLQQQKQLQDPQKRMLLCIASDCDTLLRSTSESARTHASSSAETSSESAQNVSVARNSRQTFTEQRATVTFTRICTTVLCCSMTQTRSKVLVSA